MTRTRVRHLCTECEAQSPRWLGRCPNCGAWNTLVAETEGPPARTEESVLLPADAPRPVPISAVGAATGARRSTGIGELDRVLGGGLVAGSVTLLGGEPGIGKSTLLLEALGAMAASGARGLLVAGEESTEQVRLRAERVGALAEDLFVVGETALPHVLAHVGDLAPDVLAVDSIQTLQDPASPGVPGSVTQVRDCAQRLVRMAKDTGTAVVLVGHVTKDGGLAGPRVLEHVVDTVLSFEGDRHHALRLLHPLKHRFGSTAELGLFEMGSGGLIDVEDPSALFLGDRCAGATGSIVVPVVEGARPLLVEVQALVVPTTLPAPRRSAQGFDSGRLAMLLAVLQQTAGVPLASADVFASATGGVRIREAGADLAVALAVASAKAGVAVDASVVALGEVGLGGELRGVAQTPRRLAEAARLGFSRAIVPASTPDAGDIELVRVTTLAEAMAATGLVESARPDRDRGVETSVTEPARRDAVSTWSRDAAVSSDHGRGPQALLRS